MTILNRIALGLKSVSKPIASGLNLKFQRSISRMAESGTLGNQGVNSIMKVEAKAAGESADESSPVFLIMACLGMWYYKIKMDRARKMCELKMLEATVEMFREARYKYPPPRKLSIEVDLMDYRSLRGVHPCYAPPIMLNKVVLARYCRYLRNLRRKI